MARVINNKTSKPIDLRKEFEEVLKSGLTCLRGKKKILNKELYYQTANLLICENDLRRSIQEEFRMLKRINKLQIKDVKALLGSLVLENKEGSFRRSKVAKTQLGSLVLENKDRSSRQGKWDQAPENIRKIIEDLSARGYIISENSYLTIDSPSHDG